MSMGDSTAAPIPSGVRAIAVLFALCGIYLGIAGLLLLLRPGVISMTAGAPLLFGLELSGAYMFLLTLLVGIGLAWGLVRRINLARPYWSPSPASRCWCRLFPPQPPWCNPERWFSAAWESSCA
jgi:hypothetical protein